MRSLTKLQSLVQTKRDHEILIQHWYNLKIKTEKPTLRSKLLKLISESKVSIMDSS